MKICYLGFYQADASVNDVLIEGLKKNNIQIIECVVYSKSKLLKYWQLFRKHWKIRKNYDLMIIGHTTRVLAHSDHFIVPFARLISSKKIIYNALCSNYEAAVISRDIINKKSLSAKLYWLTDYFACLCSSLVLVETEEQKKFFVDNFKINPKKCIHMWTGTNDENFFAEPIKKRKEFTIVIRGGFLPETGIEYVIEAAKKLEHENIKFLMIGMPKTEKIEKTIKGLINKNDSQNLILINKHLDYPEMRKIMLECHVSLGQFGNNKRIQRTIPHRIFESLALRLPCITGEATGVKELLTDRINCLFVKIADADDLAQKILELKNNPELRKKIAQNGYELFQKKLNPKALGKELLDAVKNLIKN